MDSTERFAPSLRPHMLHIGNRIGYSLTNRRLRSSSTTCLNYGWATLEGNGIAADGRLSPQDAISTDRYSLQLYERVAAHHVVGKRVLEVGSGRGGGATFLHRALGAQEVTGLDLTPSSVKWCTEHWSEPGVRFAVGDAEDLSLPDGSFDVVVNVESSHNYPRVDRFLAEARRVLRPGGLLALADFRSVQDMAVLVQQIVDAGFVIEEDEDIAPNVVRALALVSPEREDGIAQFAPFKRKMAHEFGGLEGSHFFRELSSREIEYRRFLARSK